MTGINKVILVGRVGNDVKINQSSVVNISIATSEKYKDKTTGEYKTVTEWHKVVFFGKLAEIVSDYVIKGSQLYIEGKLRTEKYPDKDGIERYSTKIIANTIELLGSKSANSDNEDNKSINKSKNNEKNNEEFLDDDIPF